MTRNNFESWNFQSKYHLVVNVGLAHIAPHRQVREAQHHGMLRHHAVGHHVLIDVAPTVHLREGGAREVSKVWTRVRKYSESTDTTPLLKENVDSKGSEIYFTW